MRGKSIMIQGTASNAGKSVLCAALLRIFKQDGLSCAPFKSQNMALNSAVTNEGLEIGRAQFMQAGAAGVEPEAAMNPVLLKPESDRRSQVVLMGKSIGSMTAMEYHKLKPELRKSVTDVYNGLESRFDCVVIEGAGSPAEINLAEDDIANMFMAETADAPVLLVADIDLGGVFASLYGTVLLLPEEQRKRIKGLIINKFRGDVNLLTPGIRMIEERIGIPVLGVIPWMNVQLDDEDSVTDRFTRSDGEGLVNVAVVKLRHISNFTDFQALALNRSVSVRYAGAPAELENADIVILPGTKNTIEDLLELKRTGMDKAILKHAEAGKLLFGICGGFQMLAEKLSDPLHMESDVPETDGLGLLDMEVRFSREKKTLQERAVIACLDGFLFPHNGMAIDGYEIHAGVNEYGPAAVPWLETDGGVSGVMNKAGNVLGCYLHGLFDDGNFLPLLLERAGVSSAEGAVSLRDYREREYDRVAAVVRVSLDMETVYRILRGEETHA